MGYLNKLFHWLLLGQPSQRQFGNVVREFDPISSIAAIRSVALSALPRKRTCAAH